MAKAPFATTTRRTTTPSRRITSVSMPAAPDAERIIYEANEADRRARIGHLSVVPAALPAELAAEMFTTFAPHALSEEDVAATLVRLGSPAAGFLAQIDAEGPMAAFDVKEVAHNLQAHGRGNEAEALLRQALSVESNRNGRDTRVAFELQLALARVLMSGDAVADAKRLLVDSVERQRSVLGTRHTLTLSTLETLGNLLVAQSELGYAEPLLCEVVLVRRNMQGDDAIETLHALSSLAQLLLAQGKPSEAEPLLRRALRGQASQLGEAHQATMASRNVLAEVLLSAGNIADAEALLTYALRIARHQLGEAHLQTLEQSALLAEFLLDGRRPGEARLLLTDAFEMAEKLCTRGHSLRNRLRSQLGRCQRMLGNWVKAEKHLIAAYEALRETLGLGHAATQRTLSDLIALYMAWGKPGAAAPYRAVHAQCS